MPPLPSLDEPQVDPLYAGIDAATLPECECLKDTVERCLPLWNEQIAPALQRGETVRRIGPSSLSPSSLSPS